MTNRITIRLGNLAEPLRTAANAAGVSDGEFVKQTLAEKLGVEIERYEGNMHLPSKEAIKKRWNMQAKFNQLIASQQANVLRELGVEPGDDKPKQFAAAWRKADRFERRRVGEMVEGRL